MTAIDLKKLSIFLIKAHLNGYASADEGREKILPDGSKEFEYKKKELFTRDRYYGFNPFIGQEIVWHNGSIIFGMNYYGEANPEETISPKQIYQFLQEALKKIPEDKPFRGPESFKRDNFQYINKVKGTLKKFVGVEIIFYKTKLVYKLNYHGGLVALK